MTREEAASCINTIVILKNLCYRVRGLMDVIDAQNCDKIIEMLNTVGETHKKHTETHACDCIERQAAIDACHNYEDGKEAYAYGYVVEERLQCLPPAQPEQQWIPCSEQLPEELSEVNITWINTKPESYYDFIKGKPFTGTAVYYKGRWYWYSVVCTDYLKEYGFSPNDEMDDAIKVTAWIPLPEPYKEGEQNG